MVDTDLKAKVVYVTEGKSPEPAVKEDDDVELEDEQKQPETAAQEYSLPVVDWRQGLVKLHENFKTLPKFFGEAEMTGYKWQQLKPMTVDALVEEAQLLFLKRMRFAHDVAEFELNENHHFKDESQIGLRGKYYIGMFQKGLPKPNGVGRIVTEDDSLYEGTIVDGASDGFGRLILATGEHFVGFFRDGKLNGPAAKYDVDGKFISAETYIDGKSESELEKMAEVAARKASFDKIDQRFKFNFAKAAEMANKNRSIFG